MTEESDLILNGINGAVNVTNFHYNNHNQLDGHQLISTTKIDTNAGTSLSILSTSANTISSPSNTTTTATSSIGANHVKHNSVTTNGGGRLQFFKDGKFILELATAREGDKKGWVSVPRKTYWPPTAPPNTNVNFHKNESSTSLSFSDDNSSIQSSPWQRDHCWKQTTPCRNKSKEMCMYYYRPIQYKLTNETKKYAKIKRRRPYDNKLYKFLIINDNSNNDCKPVEKVIKIKKKEENDDVDIDEDSDKNKTNDKDKDNDNDNTMDHIDDTEGIKKTVEDEKDISKIPCNNINNNNNNNNVINCNTNEDSIDTVDTKDKQIILNKKLLKKRQKLNIIIDKLIDKKPAGVKQLSNNKTLPVNINHHTSGINNSCVNNVNLPVDTNNHQYVSPRKRILRELEKGSFEETLSIKKSRSKNITNNCSTTPITTTSSIVGVQTQHKNYSYPNNVTNGSLSSSINNNQLNDAMHPSTVSIINTTAPTTRTISSYSIKSLLGHNNNNNISSNNNNSNNNISNNNHKSETYSSTSHHQSHREQILTDPSHLRAMLSSPNSPEHLGQQQMKRSMSFTTTNKKRASISFNNNSSNLSVSSKTTTPLSGPISVQNHNRNYMNNHNSPRSLNSPTPLNYNKIHSPELSPSPEQQGYSKYRNQYTSLINNHIGISSPGIPTTISSPSYNQMLTSSRDSPSGRVMSPTAELYSGRYRTNYLSSSPNNQSHNNSLQYSRHSPLSRMQQASPQHSNNKTSVINSPTNFVNNLSKSKRSESSPTRRQLSPTSDYHSHHQSRESVSSRTVPKKTAAFRQPFNSPVSSPNASSHGTSGEPLYFNSSNIEQQTDRDDNSDNRSHVNDISLTKSETEHRLSGSPMDVKRSAEYMHNNNNHPILPPGFEIDPNAMIRPSMVPSLQQSPGMYLMYPPHNPAIVPPQSPYLSMYNYHQQMSYLAATYRNPLWMSYSSRMPALMYGGAGPLNALQHNEQYPQTTLATTTPPNWSGNVPGDSNRRNKSANNMQQLNSDSVPLLRSRDEPSSDVPLNLSKH